MKDDVCTFSPPTPSVSNNAVSVIFDSTHGVDDLPRWSSTAGGKRGKFQRRRIHGFIDCTDQNVTVRLDYLKADGTWATSAKSDTVTAGTTYVLDWLPLAADWRLVTVNGGTGPTTLTFSPFNLTRNPEAGTS